MAGPDRTPSDPVTLHRDLEEEPYRFGFFQALRRLECARQDLPRVGKSVRPAGDGVRLAQEPSLAFAPATLSAFEPGANGKPPRLVSFFFGLFGPNGPLPLHLTEFARDRLRNHDDPTVSRFADLFHHRMLSFFYRAWADGQPAVQHDRPESDRFALYTGALVGFGMPSLAGRDPLPDHARYHFAGHLGCHTRHADGLRAMLAGFFDVPVEIEPFIGKWIDLPEHSRCRLGGDGDMGVLGQTAVAGDRVWDCQQKFRVVFGPLGMADYRRFLPGCESLDRLVAMVRSYVGDELEWDLKILLDKSEIPPLQLGEGAQLGLTTWCIAHGHDQEVEEVYLDPLAEVA